MADKKLQQTYCKICTNRKFNLAYNGFICDLTKESAVFEEECPDFNLDEKRLVELDTIKKDLVKIEKEDETGGLSKYGVDNGYLAGVILLGVSFLIYIMSSSLFPKSSLFLFIGGLGLIAKKALNDYNSKEK